MSNLGNKVPQMQRFWPKVDFIPFCGCWIWVGSLTKAGYGNFRDGNGKVCASHRFLYEQTIGPVPDGLELDHLCRVRSCVNPAHLEPVTRRENMFRSPFFYKESCKSGHSYKPENIYIRKNGGQACITCRNIWSRDWKRNKRAKRGHHVPA